MLHPDEAGDVAVFGVVDGVGAPEFFPVAGAVGEELRVGGVAEATGHEGDGVVVGVVLHGAVAGTVGAAELVAVLDGEIAEGFVVGHVAAAEAHGLGGVGVGVVAHGFVDAFPVEAGEVFDVGVGEHHLGVGAALGAAGVVSGAAVGEEAVVVLDVHEGLEDLGDAFRCDEGEEWCGGAEGVPDAVEVVVGGAGGEPERVLAGAVDGHQHGVIEAGGELLALVGRAAGDLDG